MKYYFTLRHVATKQETAQAKKAGAKLVNGMFGATFNRECSRVYGNYPEHLAHLFVKPRMKKDDNLH